LYKEVNLNPYWSHSVDQLPHFSALLNPLPGPKHPLFPHPSAQVEHLLTTTTSTCWNFSSSVRHSFKGEKCYLRRAIFQIFLDTKNYFHRNGSISRKIFPKIVCKSFANPKLYDTAQFAKKLNDFQQFSKSFDLNVQCAY
jgi:hypothetical protein